MGKWAQVWEKFRQDDRTFKKRFLMALFTGFSLSFTFIFIGILDLYLNNMGMFPFNIRHLILPVVLSFVIITAVLTLIFMLFKGKTFDVLLSLAVGFLLAGYIQGNYLNRGIGELTGDAVDWGQYTGKGIVNIMVWVVLLIAPLLLWIFIRKVWKKLIIILPAVLAGMQLVGLIATGASSGLTFTNEVVQKDPSGKYISEKGMFELSTKENVLVFILDRLDGKYVDDVLASDPHFFDDMEGFTYYPNNMSLYCRTYPSVTYMLTGQVSYFDKPSDRFFRESYQKGTFLPKLRENNFTTKIYTSNYYTYTDVSQLEGVADNIHEEDGKTRISTSLMLQKMANFSAYRYAPILFKQFFWFTPGTFAETVIVEKEVLPFDTDAYKFGDRMKDIGFSEQDKKNNFMYLHLKGCHADYDLNEDGEYVGPGRSDLLAQTKGYFKLLKDYMNQMKEMGLYDQSTIIITGDHGKSEDFNSLSTYKTTALFVKPKDAGRETIKTSHKPLSHDNFQATVLQAAGIDSEGFGKSIWDVAEDEKIVRRFLYKVNNPGGRLEEYEVRGDAENFANWKHIKNHPLRYDYG